MKKQFYTLSTIFEGEVYNACFEAISHRDAEHQMAEHVESEIRRIHGDADPEENYAGWVVCRVVTDEKPDSFDAGY